MAADDTRAIPGIKTDDRPLYERDFAAWARDQAERLRRARARGEAPDLDWDRLIEEVADLGKSERSAVASDLARIVEHLLQLHLSPAQQPRRMWRDSVREHRSRLDVELEESPSLRRELPDLLAKAYPRARKLTVGSLADDGIGEDAVPLRCPFTLEQIQDAEWWP